MRKQKVAKTFMHFVRDSVILGFCALRVRFCVSPRFCGFRRISIEVMAVWLCTAFCPLLGNRTCGPLTKQGEKRRVNRIPQDKLQEPKFIKTPSYSNNYSTHLYTPSPSHSSCQYPARAQLAQFCAAQTPLLPPPSQVRLCHL